MHQRPLSWLTIAAVSLSAATGWLLWVPAAGSEEPAQRFLEALRRDGYFDEAAGYVEQMRSSPLAPKGFEETADYEQALTLVASCQSARTLADRAERLKQAGEKLKRFMADHRDHALVTAARIQQAGIAIDRARINIDQRNHLPKESDQLRPLAESARALLQEAEATYAALEKQYEEAYKKFGFVDPRDLPRLKQRDQLKRDLLQMRLSQAWVRYELAQTFDPGGQERKNALGDTAKRFGDLYEKYGDYLAGLYARLGQGRCLKDLGEGQRAFNIFEELLGWPDDPEAFRTLKSRAAVQALETAVLPSVKKYKEALDIYQKWSKTAQPQEASSDEGLAIRYLAAEAAMVLAAAADAKDPQQAPARAENIRLARKNYAVVSGLPGVYQQKAKLKLLDPLLGGDTKRPEPASFVEARERVKSALELMVAAESEQRTAVNENRSDDARKCRQRVETTRLEAINYCRLALRLRREAASMDDVNVVRYQLAYLLYRAGNTEEAAVLGAFLARHYPQASAAREGARIAMAAYDGLLRAATDEEQRQFASRRTLDFSRYVIKRWPESAEADQARLVVIEAVAAEGRWQETLACLETIRPDSPIRADAELVAGQAIGAAYVRALQAPAESRPKEPLEKIAAQSQKILTDGIERMRKTVDGGAAPSQSLVAAVLALAKMYLALNQPEKALQWLNEPKIGAKTLTDANHPAIQHGNLAMETYRTALQAEIALGNLEQAQKTITELEKLARRDGDADGSRRLSQVYIALGRDLQSQIEHLRTRRDTVELTRVQKTFEMLLNKIAQRPEATSFASLDWVAETLFGLGAGFDPGGVQLPADAAKYYKMAADTYRAMLKRCEAQKGFAPQPEAVTAIRIRLARCLRRLGDYSSALDLLVAVLEKTNNLVDAQVEAAYTYQAWGELKPEYFDLAIRGGQLHPAIWGWGKLSRQVQGNLKYRETLYEARYNLALCRLRIALSAAGEQRETLLAKAENDVRVVGKLYPEMGGKRWYEKFDELLKRIQTLRGQKPAGLQALAAEPGLEKNP